MLHLSGEGWVVKLEIDCGHVACVELAPWHLYGEMKSVDWLQHAFPRSIAHCVQRDGAQLLVED